MAAFFVNGRGRCLISCGCICCAFISRDGDGPVYSLSPSLRLHLSMLRVLVSLWRFVCVVQFSGCASLSSSSPSRAALVVDALASPAADVGSSFSEFTGASCSCFCCVFWPGPPEWLHPTGKSVDAAFLLSAHRRCFLESCVPMFLSILIDCPVFSIFVTMFVGTLCISPRGLVIAYSSAFSWNRDGHSCDSGISSASWFPCADCSTTLGPCIILVGLDSSLLVCAIALVFSCFLSSLDFSRLCCFFFLCCCLLFFCGCSSLSSSPVLFSFSFLPVVVCLESALLLVSPCRRLSALRSGRSFPRLLVCPSGSSALLHVVLSVVSFLLQPVGCLLYFSVFAILRCIGTSFKFP